MLVLNAIIVALLLVITYQDLKYREIDILLFILLFSCYITQGLLSHAFIIFLKTCGLNLLFLAIQLSLLFIYFLSKGISFKAILNSSIGLGDIALLLTCCFAFSNINFMAFYLLGLLFAMATWLIYKWVMKIHDILIPMAGLFSIFMILTILTDMLSKHFQRLQDSFLIQLVYG